MYILSAHDKKCIDYVGRKAMEYNYEFWQNLEKIASVSLIGAMLLAGCSGNGQTVMKIGDTNITEGAVNFFAKLRNGYRGRRRRS